MGLTPGTPLTEVTVDRVFIGSCTNSRLEDLRAAARVARGRRAVVPAWVVPGSGLVKRAAEAEGLDRVFVEAGFEWREAGCSMCVGINGDTARRGRAGGVHVQPQLRGTPGAGGAYASHVAGDGRGRRGDRPPHRRPHAGGLSGAALHAALRRRRADRSAQRRYRPDHSGALPAQAPGHAGLRDFLFHDVRSTASAGAARVRPQPAGLSDGQDPRGGGELRLRLLTRGRGVGARRRRHPRGHRPQPRRHLPPELLQGRPAAGDPARRYGVEPAGPAAHESGRDADRRSAGPDGHRARRAPSTASRSIRSASRCC